MKKKIIAAIIALLILSLICFLIVERRKDKRITLFGNVEIRQTDMSFRVSGRLLKLYKEEGDIVKEGELIAELEDDTYKTELKRLKGVLKEKRAEKFQKTAVYKFNYPLCADYTISKEQCSNLKYDKEIAEGEYNEAVAELERAIINLDDTKMYAPYDGIILSRIRERGTILSTNDVVYSISMNEPVWIRAYIEESDLGKVKLGQKALVYSDSRPHDPYSAHVGFVSPVAEFTPKTVETTTLRTDLVYRLRIIVDNIDPYLRQGMPTTIKLLEE